MTARITPSISDQARAQSGQSLIEFALLMPVVIVFIAAIVIFGLALNARSSVQQAVREGARQAAVGKSLTDVQTLAAGNSSSRLDPADVRVCHPMNGSSQGGVGDSVAVYILDDDNSPGDTTRGVPFTLVPTSGIFAALGVSSLTVRLDPVATARLEKSVVSPVNCPAGVP